MYLDEIVFLCLERFHFLLQDVDEEAGQILGVDGLEANFAQQRAVVFNCQQMISSLGHVAKELLRVLLISSTVIGNHQLPAGLEPFLQMNKYMKILLQIGNIS